jgi:hypothetical protein
MSIYHVRFLFCLFVCLISIAEASLSHYQKKKSKVISGWNQVLQTRVVAHATKMKGFGAAMGERFIKLN